MTNFVTNYFYDLPEDLQQMIYEKEHRMKLQEVFEKNKNVWEQLRLYPIECDECGDGPAEDDEDYALHYCLGNWYCFRCLELRIGRIGEPPRLRIHENGVELNIDEE